MNKDKKWMLMTYYCPTHGDVGRVEPLQLTREEFCSHFEWHVMNNILLLRKDRDLPRPGVRKFLKT